MLESSVPINEKADEFFGQLEMMKACGIDVQGTVPWACHNVLPYEMYGELSVRSAGEET